MIAPQPQEMNPAQRLAHARKTQVLTTYWTAPPGLGGMSPPQRAVHEDTSKRRFVRGANKVGKTRLVSAEVWGFLTGTHPAWPDLPPQDVIYLAPDLEGSFANDVCRNLRELEAPGVLAPGCRYKPMAGYYVGSSRGILLSNGRSVLFRSSFQSTRSISGIWGGVLIFNEPPAKAIWGEAIRSVAKGGGLVLIAFTAVSDDRSPQDLRWLEEVIEGPGSEWSQHVIPLTYENVPHRSREEVDQQIRDCPPWERAQRIFAEWRGPALDRHFMGFADDCVAHSFPDHEVDIGISMDHGEQSGREVCRVYAYWRDKDTGQSHAMMIGEYRSSGRTTEATDAMLISQELEALGLNLYHVERARGDVNSAGKSRLTSLNVAFEQAFAEVLKSSVCPFDIFTAKKGAGSVNYGCKLINSAFLSGRFQIHERCSKAIDDYRNWRGPQSTLKSDAPREHGIDADRYFLTELLDPLEDVPAQIIKVR